MAGPTLKFRVDRWVPIQQRMIDTAGFMPQNEGWKMVQNKLMLDGWTYITIQFDNDYCKTIFLLKWLG